MPYDSIPARLQEQGRTLGDKPAYHVRSNGRWQSTSWRQYAAEARQAARALIALGFQPGQTVAILGFNRPEWCIFFHGAMAAGGTPVGIYTTASAKDAQYVAGHAEARLVLVENEAQWKKFEGAFESLPSLQHVVFMRGAAVPSDARCLSWDAFLALSSGAPDEEVTKRLHALEPTGLATLIYTSGTTGPPKGVMLTHENVAWTTGQIRHLLTLGDADATLSYLPLAHIAEQVFTLHGPATYGYQVFFAESIDALAANLKDAQPSVFFGVPRVWEKMYAGVNAKLAQAQGAKKLLAGWAMNVATARNAALNAGRSPGAVLEAQYALAHRLVLGKVREAMGFGRLRYPVSGAAPIDRSILEFMAGLDIAIREVYGQSEGTGPTSFNREGATRFGTVGQAFPGTEIRIAEDGEILVRGKNVFAGYYKEPAATAEALEDGWLHSGDLGALDATGFLSITGRKKEIIITAGGKNITPVKIEECLKRNPLIAEAVAIGDRRKFIAALIQLEPVRAAEIAGAGVDPRGSPAVLEEVERAIAAANKELSQVETVKRFHLLAQPLSIEGGELTPTLKLKRSVIAKKYAAEIDEMYAE